MNDRVFIAAMSEDEQYVLLKSGNAYALCENGDDPDQVDWIPGVGMLVSVQIKSDYKEFNPPIPYPYQGSLLRKAKLKLPFPSFVLTRDIQVIEDPVYRYSLSIPFYSNSTKTMLVILKNPSVAGVTVSDPTANQVCRFAHNTQFGKVVLVNLFAYRTTDSSELKKVAAARDIQHVIGLSNDDYIKAAVKMADRVIVAWGTPPNGFEKHYDDRIKSVKNLLGPNRFYVNKLWRKKYPLHAQVWPKVKVEILFP